MARWGPASPRPPSARTLRLAKKKVGSRRRVRWVHQPPSSISRHMIAELGMHVQPAAWTDAMPSQVTQASHPDTTICIAQTSRDPSHGAGMACRLS